VVLHCKLTRSLDSSAENRPHRVDSNWQLLPAGSGAASVGIAVADLQALYKVAVPQGLVMVLALVALAFATRGSMVR